MILSGGRILIPSTAPSECLEAAASQLCCSLTGRGTVSPFVSPSPWPCAPWAQCHPLLSPSPRPSITSPWPRLPEGLAGDTLGLSGTNCLRLSPLSPGFQNLQLRFTLPVLTGLSSYKFLCWLQNLLSAANEPWGKKQLFSICTALTNATLGAKFQLVTTLPAGAGAQQTDTWCFLQRIKMPISERQKGNTLMFNIKSFS